MKNKGHGRGTLYVRGTYTAEAEAELRPDGTVHFRRKVDDKWDDDHTFDQPSEEVQKLLKERYEDIKKQELPETNVNTRLTLPPELKYDHAANKIVWAAPLDTTRYVSRTFYLYGGKERDHVDMIEIRKDLLPEVAEREGRGKGESKSCIPWFPYGDREWKPGVPAAHDKPLFGQIGDSTLFMWHEGPKAASAATAASKFDSGHPWQGFLSRFTHISHQGGAYPGAVEDTDWSPLNQKDITVFQMPDNDAASYDVAERIQKQLPDVGVLKIIHFGPWAHIPKSFDLADDWRRLVPPAKLRSGMKDVDLLKAVVPSEDDLKLSFRTNLWATDLKYDPITKKRTPVVRGRFAKQFRQLTYTGELVEWDEIYGPGNPMDDKQFNTAYSRLHPVGLNLAACVRGKNECLQFCRPGYWPGTAIVYRSESDADGTYALPPMAVPGSERIRGGMPPLNMYRPSHVVERAPKANMALRVPELSLGTRPWRETEKSIRPFLVYLRHLIPNAFERKMLVRWACNNLTAEEPGHRVPWAVLMVSVMQGTGKTTLGTILSTLLGGHNVSNIDGSTLNDGFTGWLENKQLVIVEEMKEESGFRLYERLKAPISNPVVSVRKMHTDRYDTENFISLLAMSNHLSALSVPNDDRRWFFPEVTSKLAPDVGSGLEKMAHRYFDAYARGDRDLFSELYRWLADEGYSDLLWWMRRYGRKLHTHVRPWKISSAEGRGLWRTVFRRAPLTVKKAEVMQRSGPAWVAELKDKLCVLDDDNGGLAHAICVGDVKAWLQERKLKFSPADLVEDLGKIGYRLFVPNPDSRDDKAKRGFWYVLKGGNLEANPPRSQVMIRSDLFDEVSDRQRADLPGFRTEELLFISDDWVKRLDRFLRVRPSEASERSAKIDREEAAKSAAQLEAKIDAGDVPF